MVFKLEAADNGVFEFQIPGSKKIYSLPLIQDLPVEIEQTMAKAQIVSQRVIKLEQRGREHQITTEDMNLVLDAQTALMERYAPGVVSKISGAQFRALMEAWGEASRVSVGESSAS